MQTFIKHKSLRIILAVFGIVIIFVFINMTKKEGDSFGQLITPNATLSIDIADSQSDREKGLSGRDQLGKQDGMLFVFDSSSDKNCFWMKDMKFAIDMVWLDEQKNVVTVTQNVGPETYPRVFCPETAARYGLEINANSAERYGIKQGEKLRF